MVKLVSDGSQSAFQVAKMGDLLLLLLDQINTSSSILLLLSFFVYEKYGNQFWHSSKIKYDKNICHILAAYSDQRYCIQIGFYKMQIHATKVRHMLFTACKYLHFWQNDTWKMFHNDVAFRRVTWRRVLMIMTSQTRLDRHQFEANKS